MDLNKNHVNYRVKGKNLIVTIDKKEEFIYCILPVSKFKTEDSISINEFYISKKTYDFLNKKL